MVLNLKITSVCQRVDDTMTIMLQIVKASWVRHPSREKLLQLVKQGHTNVSCSG